MSTNETVRERLQTLYEIAHARSQGSEYQRGRSNAFAEALGTLDRLSVVGEPDGRGVDVLAELREQIAERGESLWERFEQSEKGAQRERLAARANECVEIVMLIDRLSVLRSEGECKHEWTAWGTGTDHCVKCPASRRTPPDDYSHQATLRCAQFVLNESRKPGRALTPSLVSAAKHIIDGPASELSRLLFSEIGAPVASSVPEPGGDSACVVIRACDVEDGDYLWRDGSGFTRVSVGHDPGETRLYNDGGFGSHISFPPAALVVVRRARRAPAPVPVLDGAPEALRKSRTWATGMIGHLDDLIRDPSSQEFSVLWVQRQVEYLATLLEQIAPLPVLDGEGDGELVERVARAIHAVPGVTMTNPRPWEDAPAYRRARCIELARAASAALASSPEGTGERETVAEEIEIGDVIWLPEHFGWVRIDRTEPFDLAYRGVRLWFTARSPEVGEYDSTHNLREGWPVLVRAAAPMGTDDAQRDAEEWKTVADRLGNRIVGIALTLGVDTREIEQEITRRLAPTSPSEGNNKTEAENHG